MKRRAAALAAALAALLIANGTAPAAEPLKIGVLMSYTGPSAIGGQEVDAAIAAYQQLHGSTVAGRTIQIVRADTGGANPDVAARHMQELAASDKVDFVIGPDFTPTTIAAGTVSTQAKLPTLVVTAAASGSVANAPYMINFGFSTRQYVGPLANWAATNGLKKTYVLYSDYAPGIEAARIFKEAYTAVGGTVAGEVAVPLNATDLSAYAQRVKDAAPDGLFVFLPPGQQPLVLLHALTENGTYGGKSKLKILDNGALSDEPRLDTLGDATIGIISSFIYSDNHASAANRAFVRAFEAPSGGTLRPDFYAAIAYDAMDAIYHVVAAQHGVLDPDRTMQLLRAVRMEGPRGPISVDPATRLVTENDYIRRVERHGAHLVNVEIKTFPAVPQ
jgi:branched-chain amino acid transport system substrate-binding protein